MFITSLFFEVSQCKINLLTEIRVLIIVFYSKGMTFSLKSVYTDAFTTVFRGKKLVEGLCIQVTI